MARVNRPLFIMVSILPSPTFADSGYMGVPTDVSFGGFVLGALLLIGGAAVIGAAYGFLSYLVEKLRARK